MTDRRTVQLVIGGLLLFALVGLLGMVYLIATHHTAAEVSPLATLIGPAVGAVAAVLVSTRSADPEAIAANAQAEQAAGLAQLAAGPLAEPPPEPEPA